MGAKWQTLSAGRDTIVAAVAGLLFLVFLILSGLAIPLLKPSLVLADHQCPSGYTPYSNPAIGDICVRSTPPDCTAGETPIPLTNTCFVPRLSHASGHPASVNIEQPPLPDSPVAGFTPEGLVGQLITKILPIILGLGGFATVIIIVISGIQFVTSSGNPEAAAAARGRLTMALVGFVIIILAFAITQIIDTIFLGGSGIF